MIFQRTLKRAVTVSGIGMHSGEKSHLTIKPSRPGSGISFSRKDRVGSPAIPAHFSYVVSTQMATTLGLGEITISTVEHVLAAVHGCGIDNAQIEVSGPEIPILDGSSLPFLHAIEEAGILIQPQARPTLALRRRVEFREGDKWGFAEPSSKLEILGSFEWSHPAIGKQEFLYQQGATPFSELAPARTFGFLHEVEALKKMGLARGGSLESAVVLDDQSVLNPGGLRFSDEFARHKVLDALGDFKLAGVGIQGYFRLHRSGHDVHRKLLAEIFSNPNNYEILDDQSREEQRPVRIRGMAARAGWVAAF